ncbi:hypothetical protein AGOR_G00209420 [Albula goreensis]|uniref:Ig-like domain-containing protein n=1 Tax=Albula goreensis TaxID=1534307 RepID=A0A8T3CTZ5_9TELE|nr:hypothetical protein AGOR_G00209420 [Albula goreensis]
MYRLWTLPPLTGFFALVAIAEGVVFQHPSSLRVPAGKGVTLHCDISGVTGRCAFVWWLLVQPDTGLTIYRNPNIITIPGNTRTADRACLLHIPSTNRSDTGTYYCAVSDSRMSYYGNGTTLIVTERAVTDITMDILVPVPQLLDQSDPVTLLCLVSGVDPSKAKVHWEVEGKVRRTELPQANALASDAIRTRLSVPSQSWARGVPVTCVLETDKGLSLNKTISRAGIGTFSQCVYLVAAVGGVSFLIFIATIITVCVILLKGNHRMKESLPRHTAMNWSRQPQQDLEQVQYTSLRFEGRRREAVSHF